MRYTYFEKPSTSPLVFHGREVCSTRQKIVILAEEVKRRLLNTDHSHPMEERLDILEGFSRKLIDSNYKK